MTRTVSYGASSPQTAVVTGLVTTTVDDAILNGVWSTPIICADRGTFTATPGAGGTITLQFSSDSGATWTGGLTVSSAYTSGIPTTANLIRATSTVATGALTVVTPAPIPDTSAAFWGSRTKMNSFITKIFGGALQTTTIADTTITYGTAVGCPIPWYAIRLHYQFWGKSGTTEVVTDFKCIVSASDNIGNMDFTNVGAAGFKFCVSPRAAGTEYNTIVTDGSPGWKAYTWAGAATLSIANPGAGAISITTGDIVYEQSRYDAANSCWPALIRYINGSAGFSYANNLTGQQTRTNLVSDFPAFPIINTSRTTADAVTTPSGWSYANTPSATGSSPPLYVEFFTAAGVLSCDVMMDSRGAVSAETATTAEYRSFEFYLMQAIRANGFAANVMRHSISGAGVLGANTDGTSGVANYWVSGYKAQSLPQAANWLIYLIYTANDGTLTDALTTLVLGRAVDMAAKARALGQRVMFMPTFPKDTGYTAAQLLNIATMRAFATSVGDAIFDPIAAYGTATGDWALYRFDANHMTNAGYKDMAIRCAALMN